MEGVPTVGAQSPKESQAHDLYGRRWRIGELLLRAWISAQWLAWEIMCPAPMFEFPWCLIATRIGATVIVLSCAVMLSLRNCSPRTAELAVTFAISLWSALIMWGALSLSFWAKASYPGTFSQLFQWDFSCLLMMEVLCMGLRPSFKWVCILNVLVNGFIVFALSIYKENVNLCTTACLGTLVPAMSILFYGLWRHHEMHTTMLAEQLATASLVKMTFDAGFWLAADGDTIVRGDNSLNSLMGTAMDGKRVTDFLADSDRERFHLLTKGSKGTVNLMHVTMLRQDREALLAELFIVAASNHALNCFLIGLRLSEPMSAEVALPAAASSREAVAPREQEPVSPGALSFQHGFVSRSSAAHLVVERQDLEVGSVPSFPTTLASCPLQPLQVDTCTRLQIVDALLPAAGTDQLRETVRASVALCCDHAVDGALVLIASANAFADVFQNWQAEDQASQGPRGTPALRTSDGGYMTARLRGIHVSDKRFQAAFQEFTEHSETDRWPHDHPDAAARDLPKDGALLLDPSGFRLKCAAKILGLGPPRMWQGVGTKHEAAVAAAWAVPGCIAFVRSETGIVHAIIRAGGAVRAFQILPEQREGHISV